MITVSLPLPYQRSVTAIATVTAFLHCSICCQLVIMFASHVSFGFFLFLLKDGELVKDHFHSSAATQYNSRSQIRSRIVDSWSIHSAHITEEIIDAHVRWVETAGYSFILLPSRLHFGGVLGENEVFCSRIMLQYGRFSPSHMTVCWFFCTSEELLYYVVEDYGFTFDTLLSFMIHEPHPVSMN